MYLQNVESVFDLRVHRRNVLRRRVLPERGRAVEVRVRRSRTRRSSSSSSRSSSPRRSGCSTAKLPLPGYEMILKAAHTFNLLDARGAISVTERAAYIGRIRNLSRAVATAYVESREALGFPMLRPSTGRRRHGHPVSTVVGWSSTEQREGGPVSEATLLVELFTEELPPKALKSLGRGVRGRPSPTGCATRGFLRAQNAAVTPFATPRRLARRDHRRRAGRAGPPTCVEKLMPRQRGVRTRTASATRGAAQTPRQGRPRPRWPTRYPTPGMARITSTCRRTARPSTVWLRSLPRVSRSRAACRRRSTRPSRSCRSPRS